MKTSITNKLNIPWWYTELGKPEINAINNAINNKNISQGIVTDEFEKELAKILNVPYIVCTTNGTVALTLSFLASGIGPGDEVIIPNRTYVASANSFMILGAVPILIDSRKDRPNINEDLIENKITSRTKAILPVHLNGNAVDMDKINIIAKKHKLVVIEDACPSFMSKFPNQNNFLGTRSRFGCFSLGVVKLITTGQGGFVACHNKEDYNILKKIKMQGANEKGDDVVFDRLSGNYKFTDMLASVGLAQINRLKKRIEHQKTIYDMYKEGLKGISFLKLIEVEKSKGELPLRIECLCTERFQFMNIMKTKGVSILTNIKNLNQSPHIEDNGSYPNSDVYGEQLVVLPCGPDQPLENIEYTIDIIKNLNGDFTQI